MMTDRAWNRLYSRFEQDGLIPESKAEKRTLLSSSGFRWAVGLAAIFVGIISILVFRPATTNADLLTLHNAEDAPTLVTTLEDGSVVYLSGYTSLQYPLHFGENKRKVALQGDAFFEISKNAGRPFVIDTEKASIEVLGTAFNVRNQDKNLLTLSVREGEVRVTSKESGQVIHVRGGEMVSLKSGKMLMSRADVGEFGKYFDRIHFKDERLADIVRIINMNSDSVSLKLSPDLEDRLLTVSFSGDSPQTMAELICMALNLHYTQQQNVIILSKPDN